MDDLEPDVVPDVTVVVVAGGSGTRFRAALPSTSPVPADKLAAPLGTGTVLGSLLSALEGWRVVVVGPQVQGGPLAGFAAGLEGVDSEVVVLLGGDQPFAATAVPRLFAALRADPALDAVVGVDPTGRRQPLLSAHRRASALAVLRELGEASGRPLRALFAGAVGEVAVTEREALDVDVPDDLVRAGELSRVEPSRVEPSRFELSREQGPS